MARPRALTAERLREILNYDPATGVFTWRERGRGRWLDRPLGSVDKGYLHISVNGQDHFAQRLAWLYVNGEWPTRLLRFQNGITTDCRIDNLRDGFFETTEFKHLSGAALKTAYTRQRRERYPDSYRATDIKKRFGITLDDYKRMRDEQGNVCAICGKPETVKRNGKDRWLAVDHCHTTNKIRGLLCGKCNPMIGYSQDDPTILDKAAAYLRRHAPDDFPVRATEVYDDGIRHPDGRWEPRAGGKTLKPETLIGILQNSEYDH